MRKEGTRKSFRTRIFFLRLTIVKRSDTFPDDTAATAITVLADRMEAILHRLLLSLLLL
jgi:hypothetical protein